MPSQGYRKRFPGESEWPALYRAGHSPYDIAARHGSTRSTVYRRLRAAGVIDPARQPQAKPRREAKWQAVADEYRAGVPLRAAAEKHGFTYKSAYVRMRRLGVRPEVQAAPRCRACQCVLPPGQEAWKRCAECLVLEASPRPSKTHDGHRRPGKALESDAAAGRLICGLPLRCA